MSVLRDPFEVLRSSSSTTRHLVPIRSESDLDEVERTRRDRYVNRIKLRYSGTDIRRVVNALRQSITQKAILETSNGPLERDPVCVFTRPIDDEATCVAYAHTDEIINLARQKAAAIDLGYELATRGNMETVFDALRPIFYEHCGHGTEEALLGQNRERIVDSDNVHILKGCMASAIACHSDRIAKLAVEKGCIAFRAYKRELRFMTDFSRTRLMLRLLRDKKCVTLEDLNGAERFVAESMKAALIHDRDSLMPVGDPQARIAHFGAIDRQKYRRIMRG